MFGGVRWLAVAMMVAGCLDAQSSPCGNGHVCAPGSTCIATLDVCAVPEQLTACAGAADGARCATSEIAVGTCTMDVCVSSGCGNKIVEPGEACDDGNAVSGDGCSADCKSTEVCGNKIVDRDEQCDCGTVDDVNPACPGPNSDTSGLCSLDCRLRCGDGVVSADEGCDPGVSDLVSCAGTDSYERGITTCSASCQPVISADTCRYIGFRTRVSQPMPPMVDGSPTSRGDGFLAGGDSVVRYVDSMAVSSATASFPIHAVWAADDLHAFAVGDGGGVVSLVGGSWNLNGNAGTTADLRDVWGRAADDVYAIGDSTVVRWNGTSWVSLAPPAGPFRAIAGDASHLYVVGDGGTVAVYDGAQWTIENVGTSADLTGVWAAGGLVVAVGASGTIVQNDGTGWVPGRTATSANLTGVWGSVQDGFFASGERGTVLFFDGRVWRPLALGRGFLGPANQTFVAIAGVPGVTVGLIGTDDLATYEGAAWAPAALPTAETIDAVWGAGPDDVFAVGRNGTILHHDGLRWTVQSSPTTVDLHAVWGTAPDDVYASGDAFTLLHYDGASWSTLRAGAIGGTSGDFTGLYALAPGDVLASGPTGIYRYDGSLAQVSTNAASSVWGTDATHVWAAGSGISAFDGVSWAATSITDPVVALSGTSATDVYAVGPTSYHFDGSTWSPAPFGDGPLTDVCASPDLGVFVAGPQGTLRRWDGTAIEPFVSRTTADLDTVFITGHLVFMAGTDGTLDVMVFHR